MSNHQSCLASTFTPARCLRCLGCGWRLPRNTASSIVSSSIRSSRRVRQLSTLSLTPSLISHNDKCTQIVSIGTTRSNNWVDLNTEHVTYQETPQSRLYRQFITFTVRKLNDDCDAMECTRNQTVVSYPGSGQFFPPPRHNAIHPSEPLHTCGCLRGAMEK